MNNNSKILVTGSSGMVGKALVKNFSQQGFSNLLTPSSKELDLRNQRIVHDYFKTNKVEYVVHLAGKIGGIKASIAYPVEFMYENLIMALNIIHAANEYHTQKLLFVGSSCIYPRECSQPMKEQYLLEGKLEPTNEGYAIAKIAGIKLCEYYNDQYRTNYISLIPCNLYGYNDHFGPDKSHVISALIYKMHNAKINQLESVEIWGTGNTRREFLFVDDFADSIVFFLLNHNADTLDNVVNIGAGSDITIKELSSIIKDIVGYHGELKFAPEKPDGMPKKLLDVSKAASLGWNAKVSLPEGLRLTYNWYLQHSTANAIK